MPALHEQTLKALVLLFEDLETFDCTIREIKSLH
jgi:hypothetical protein